MLRNLLIFRLIVLNTIGFAGVAWGLLRGDLQSFFEKDSSHLTSVCAAMFVVGLISVFVRGFKLSAMMNRIKDDDDVHSIHADKIVSKTRHISDYCMHLVTVGFIGTLLGIGMALTSLETFDVSSPDAALNMIPQMTSGLNVAVYTALVGTILGFWLDINRSMLQTATECMIVDLNTAKNAYPYEGENVVSPRKLRQPIWKRP